MMELDSPSKPKPFYILAFGEEKPDFISRCIEAAIRAPYSHIGICHDGTLYHATGKGFHKSRLSDELNYEVRHWFFWKKKKRAIIRRKVMIPVERECCALAWLEARIGTKYSLVQYLGFVFPVLRFIPFVNNGRRETVCSEVAADFCWDNTPEFFREIVRMALGDNDWVCPKKCMDVLAGIFGEDPTSHLYGGNGANSL